MIGKRSYEFSLRLFYNKCLMFKFCACWFFFFRLGSPSKVLFLIPSLSCFLPATQRRFGSPPRANSSSAFGYCGFPLNHVTDTWQVAPLYTSIICSCRSMQFVNAIASSCHFVKSCYWTMETCVANCYHKSWNELFCLTFFLPNFVPLQVSSFQFNFEYDAFQLVGC